MLQHKPYSFPIDVWALGTLMYLLMSLRMPFYHENDKKSRKLTLEQPVDLKNKNVCLYSKEARNLIDEML